MSNDPFQQPPTTPATPAPAPYPQSPTPYAETAAPMTPDAERRWGMLAHVIPLVAMVVSAGFLGFIVSLVVYLAYRDRGPFVRQAAANSLNVQITMGIVLLISLPLMLILVGFVSYFIALVIAFVLHVIAAMKANDGEWYTPPMTISFVK